MTRALNTIALFSFDHGSPVVGPRRCPSPAIDASYGRTTQRSRSQRCPRGTSTVAVSHGHAGTSEGGTLGPQVRDAADQLEQALRTDLDQSGVFDVQGPTQLLS